MRYSTPEAFRRALDDRLPHLSFQLGLPLDRLRKYVAFERFLARLQVAAPDRWVLKGGLAINCRLGQYSRPSKDIDLAHPGSAGSALQELSAVAETDAEPDDHFRFRASLAGQFELVDREGHLNLRLDVHLAGRRFEHTRLDIALEPDLEGRGEVRRIPTLFDFADLPPVTVAIVPVERHLADKVDAYLSGHINQRAISTREKDLVDIVLLAAVEPIRADDLRRELHHVLHADRPLPFRLPAPPSTWGGAYRKLAAEVGLEERDVDEAFDKARRFLDPVLDGSAPGGAQWDPRRLVWEIGVRAGSTRRPDS